MEAMNAVLLAGGESSRFGTDKALAEYKDKLLIKRIVETLDSVFDKVYVIVDQAGKYSFLKDVEFAVDLIADCGPLGGIYTALKASDQKYNFIMACDMPCINHDFLKLLKERRRDYDILLPVWKDGMQPLAAVYSKDCLPEIETNLEADKFKVVGVFSNLKVEYLGCQEIKDAIKSTDYLFYNVNYKRDLEKLKIATGEMEA